MQKIEWIDLGGVNSYLIQKDGKFLLVDTGGHLFMDKSFDNRRQKLDAALAAYGVNETNLKLILLTHGDNDHVCNAKYFSKKFQTKIAIHYADAIMVKQPSQDGYLINSNYRVRILNLIFRLLHSKIRKLMEKVNDEFEPFIPDIEWSDGASLSDYGFDGKIIHTPGHTKGSVCILDTAGNLIAGDLFVNQKKPELAWNAEDFQILGNSASKVLQLDIHTIYPGHGKPFAKEDLQIFVS